jgi:ribonuclease VapC
VSKAVILDASALLALLNNEHGGEEVRAVIGDAHMSSVNVAEAAGKLADAGMPNAQIKRALAVGFETLPFGDDEIVLMPKVRKLTKKHGLSLGDRCCVATALARKQPVLTADRAWAKLKIRGLKIQIF